MNSSTVVGPFVAQPVVDLVDTSQAPWRSVTSARAASRSAGVTTPVGFAGEFTMTARPGTEPPAHGLGSEAPALGLGRRT